MILTVRTDNPDAEIGLFDIDGTQIDYRTWTAHRELSATIHLTIENLLKDSHVAWEDITGVAYYAGPGSFTGLRIGAAVVNALALANQISVIQTTGKDWIEVGIQKIRTNPGEFVVPEYGSNPHITPQKR
jgi:tRNA threonylcarbamoyladenosine biosynthesis protein TsaB